MRRKIGLFIVAVIATAAIIYWFYPSRAGVVSTTPGNPASASAQDKAGPPSNSTVVTATTAHVSRQTNSSFNETGWKAILENLAALLKRDKVEVCGLSDFDAALFVAGDTEVGTAAVNTTLAQVTGILVSSTQPREQALGLYMQAHLAEWARNYGEQSKYRICDGDLECIGQKISASLQMPGPQATASRSTDVTPLITLALASRDPSIIATALYACRGIDGGACRSISADHWTANEPNNAAAWMTVADTAATRQDARGQDAALRRAAIATEYDSRKPSLALVTDSEFFISQSPLVQDAITHHLVVVSSAMSPIRGLAGHCLHDKRIDNVRDMLCDTLAKKLLDKDESITGITIAGLIGKKMGWDAAQLQMQKDERTVFEGSAQDVSFSNRYGCEQLEKTKRWVTLLAKEGERGIVRKLVADSGKTLAQLAAQYRIANSGGGK